MTKVSTALVFTLVVMNLNWVMGYDDDPWKTVIDEATKAGLSPDAITEAQKAIDDGTAEDAAQNALNGGSLEEWVQNANAMAGQGSSALKNKAFQGEASQDDEAPEGSYKANSDINAPIGSPIGAPLGAPELSPTNAPSATPLAAPRRAQGSFA
ncbi:hypothetical protein RJT34_25732 [Clitoria ternatea]|uniref:Uncharacterized protein n=1 Tax=Clitoria ternatea TaxID=43366 RepID=A0AAN9FWR2_CLITE